MVADLNHPAFAAAFLNSDHRSMLCDSTGRVLGVSEALRQAIPDLPEDLSGQTLCISAPSFNDDSGWHSRLSGTRRETRLTGQAYLKGSVSLSAFNLIAICPLTVNGKLTGYRITFNQASRFEASLPSGTWQQWYSTSQIGFCLFDESFRILSANPVFHKLTAMVPEESVKIHQLLSVDGNLQEWLLRTTTLTADAELIRKPGHSGFLTVNTTELSGHQLFWCSITDAGHTQSGSPPDEAATRLSLMFKQNSNAIALVSADGLFTDVNHQLADLLRLNRADIIGQPVFGFNAPDSYELPVEVAQEFSKTGFLKPFEKQLVRSDGQVISVLVQLLPDKNAKGEFSGAWNFIQPINEQVRKHLNHDHYLDSLFTSSTDLMVLTDLNSRILMANQAFASLIQQSPKSLIGQSLDDWVRREDVTLEQRLHRPMLMKQGYTDLYEQRLLIPDQPDVPVSVRRSLVRDHQQRPEAIWTIMRDASVQHKLISSLANAERRFRSLFSNSIDAIAFWTQKDELRYANRAYLDLIGYSQEELRGLTFKDFTPPGWEESDSLMAEQISERGYSDIVEKEVLRKDGSIVPITLRASAVRDNSGEITGSWIIIRDISELKETLRRLQHSENMLQQTSRMSRVGGWELNVEQMMFSLTEETFQLLSVPRSFHTSVRNIAKLLDVSYEDEAMRRVQQVYRTGRSETIEMKLAGFSPERWVRVSAQLGYEDQGTPYVYGAIQDISEFVKQQRSLESARDTYQKLAFHDPLTKLPNRLLLEDRFQQISGQARRDNNHVALMVIDLDDFKEINDRHGHPAGDALLIDIAQRLQGTIRASDTVARLGGDEFVIIAMLSEPEQARNLAEKIVDSINRPYRWKRDELQTACSIGIALLSGDEDTFEYLYARADKALYSVKAGDKGTFKIGSGQD